MDFTPSQNARRHTTSRSLRVISFALLFAPALALAADAPTRSDSSAFLAQHQGELATFFGAHGSNLLRNSLPVLVSVLGNLLLATAIVGWLIDIPLSWAFSTIFAPAYAKFTRALIYSSGRLVLALLFSVILAFSALLGINAGAATAAFLVVAVLTVPAIVLQVGWVSYQYRTRSQIALLFYCALLLVHGLALLVLAPTLFARQVNTAVAQAVNTAVVPELQDETSGVQHDAAAIMARCDSTQATVLALRDRLAHDQAEESDLQRQIAASQNSPAVIFSRIVLERAQGNLAGAGTDLAAFIHDHPNDPHAGLARGELTAVNEALAAQLALGRQEQAAQAAATAKARSQLLSRAASGKATLSEMRRALIGKTTADVAALFGAPTATAADRWGYGRRMIFDPETSESLGLTVVFSEGIVQGVDYYYGSGP